MSKRRRAKQTRDLLSGIGLVVLGIVLLGGLIGAYVWVRSNQIAYDPNTNCPVGGPTAIHAVMIDRSDKITGQQAQQVREFLGGLRREAAFATRFDIYTFEGNATDELAPKLSLCAPGKPEDANEIYENPELIRRNYESRFANLVDGVVKELLNAATLPTSPLVESIRAAAITSFAGASLGSAHLRVTLVSDMIQNSDKLSQFKSNDSFESFSKTFAWSSLRPQLKGAEVRILYLLRGDARRNGKPIQDRGHQLFWEELLTASGGTVQSFQPI